MRTSAAWRLKRLYPANSARRPAARPSSADGLDGMDPERLDDRAPPVHGPEDRGAGGVGLSRSCSTSAGEAVPKEVAHSPRVMSVRPST